MVAVISGATKGIGKAIAERFAQAGFDLFLAARSNADLVQLKSNWEATYKINVYVQAIDFSKKADILLFADFVKSNTNSVDVLVNNVGQYVPGHLFDFSGGKDSKDHFMDQININLMSAHYLTEAFMPGFEAKRMGHIFTIGSLLSVKLRESGAFYTITKHALRTWHQLLFEYARNFQVKATLVLPSSTLTASWGEQPNGEEFIQPETVAEAIYDCFTMPTAAVVDELSIKTISKSLE